MKKSIVVIMVIVTSFLLISCDESTLDDIEMILDIAIEELDSLEDTSEMELEEVAIEEVIEEVIEEDIAAVEEVQTEDPDVTVAEETVAEEAIVEEEVIEEAEEIDPNATPAIAFTLEDQYGVTHTLDEYKGKVIFLNFWATWCPPCVAELPDIQQLYEAYGSNEGDVIVLGVAYPNDQSSYTSEGSKASVTSFLSENGYTYPTIMDMNGTLTSEYSISAYPTTFMIDENGNVYGYVSGMLTYDIMVEIVEETLSQ